MSINDFWMATSLWEEADDDVLLSGLAYARRRGWVDQRPDIDPADAEMAEQALEASGAGARA